ncbi:MAG: lipid-A-disaccharide synthase [bacterium]|nr:lipid-A-disaccharide synthase [bacterium]
MTDNGAAAPPRIFIVAGELSGDLIGSMLIRQLLKREPALRVTGLGGERMAEAGADLRYNLVRDLAIIGFTEVIIKFPKIRRVFYDTVDALRREHPDVLVLIDYPGFNLRLAEQAHRLGIKVVYYVCPQVWAWHHNRIHKLRKFVDKALVILPFEESFLRQGGVDARFVGTPWLDMMVLTMTREEVIVHFGLDPAKRIIGLLPGSRRREVESLLPTMLEAAEKIQAQAPDVQFVIPRATTVRPEIIDHLLTMAHVPVKVVDAYRYNVRAAMDLAIVASGTATLETGLLGTPMIIIYKVGFFSWLIAKGLVKIPYIGLINIVAGDMVVPELLQDQCTPQNIADRSLKILGDPREIERVKYQLAKVREKMGGRGASAQTAEIVLDLARGGAKAMAANNQASHETPR